MSNVVIAISTNKLSPDELFNSFHTKKKSGNQKIMWNNIIYLLYVITWSVTERTIPDIVQNLSFNWPFWALTVLSYPKIGEKRVVE